MKPTALKPTYAIADLVPHSGTMSLLDTVIDWDEERLTAQVCIRPDSLFVAPLANGSQAVPAWIGIEYMAQAIAAYAGVQARQRGEPVRVGFLVGSRKYTCNQPGFAVGSQLTITVEREMQADNGLSVFSCRLLDASNGLEAQANLNVFQPDDVEAFLNESTQG